jgi:hypothetical protein
MVKKAEDIYRDALQLNEQQREELIRLLTAQHGDGIVDPEVESAAVAEAERRLRAVEAGEEELVPGDDVMRELRRIVSG